MKEITRFIEATKTRDYVLPAIQLMEYSGGIKATNFKRYGKRAIHIGVDEGNGKVACLCGKHHNRINTKDWDSLKDVEKHPNITCGSCLRSMKAIVRLSNTRPFLAVMEAVGQKITTAKFHVKQKRTNTSTSTMPCNVKPESRLIEAPVFTPQGTCSQSMDPPAIDGLTDHFLGNSLYNAGFNTLDISNGIVSTSPKFTQGFTTKHGSKVDNRITFMLHSANQNRSSNIKVVVWGPIARVFKGRLHKGTSLTIRGLLFSYTSTAKLPDGTVIKVGGNEIKINKIAVHLTDWALN